MRRTKLIKIKNGYALIVPETIAKLYAFEEGEIFNLEVNEKDKLQKIVFLTYAKTVK